MCFLFRTYALQRLSFIADNGILLLTFWWLIAMPFNLLGQVKLNFTNITQQDGLASDNIVCMLQDDQGFMWIGTENGLNRFDGQHFLRFGFDPQDQESLSGNSIYALLEDNRQRLWVGTLNGLNLLLKNSGKFKRIPTLDQEGKKITVRVNEIYEDRQNNIWISTDNSGLFKLRDDPAIDHIVAVPFSYQADSLSVNKSIEKIEIRHAKGDYLWISTQKGVDRLHIPSGKIEHFLFPRFENTSVVVTGPGFNDFWDGRDHIFFNRNGHICFLDINDTDRGIRLFEEYFAGLPNKLPALEKGVMRLGMEGTRKLVLASRENIIWIDLLTGASTFLDKQIISSYKTNIVLLDQQDNIWFGTYGGGISVGWRQNQFINFYKNDPEDPGSISAGQIRSLVKDDQGNLWIGTLRSGLHKYTFDQNGKPKRVQSLQTLSGEPHEFRDAEIIQLTKDQTGKIWITTSFKGLFKMDPLTLQFKNFNHTPLTPSASTISENRVWGLEVDPSNKVWVGTWSKGLNYLDPETSQVKFYTKGPDKQDALLNDFIRTLYLESDSILWIGTRDGLSRMNIQEETFTHFTHSPEDPNSLSNNLVWCIFEDREEVLWIGTNIGINKFNRQTGQFEQFFESDGLPNNSIYGISEDLKGTLWVNTQDGLASRLSDQNETVFQPIVASDGLPSSGFLPKAQFLDQQSGILYFGTVDGLITINPEWTQQEDLLFKPQIHAVSIFNLSGSDDQATHHYYVGVEETSVKLTHEDKMVEITLSDLSWDLGNTYKYEYHLAGFSEQWRAIGQDRVITFNSLAPGSYTLFVRKKGLDQKKSPEVNLITIRVLPPWWKTWWAYLSYLTLIAGGVFGLYRYQLRRQLRKQEMENLRALDAFKTKFFTNISHEFRTPLTIISGMAGQIMDNPQVWARKGSQMIKQNSSNLLNLVNQILDLRKLEANELQLNMVQGDVVKYLHYLTQSYEQYAQSKGLKLHFLPAVETLVMDYDPEKLLRIISNLLSNAVKYTPDNGNVYFQLDHSVINGQSFLQLRVEDTGTGIPDDQLNNIFDRFYQVDDSTTRKGEGTGIGLALTKEMVHLMNGSIDVKSTLGEGTTFTVLLPVTNESSITEVLSPEVGQVEPPVMDKPINQPASIEKSQADIQPEGELPTLLIVEDNPNIRHFLVACLEYDYQLETATNGQEGIDLALDIVPDLIISDVMMPEKDGFELCATLKHDKRTSHIPIILLTAKADMESKISGLKTGADAYLTKPFEPEELMVRLEKLFELRQKLQARYRSFEIKAVPENKEDEFVQKVREAVLANLSDETFGIVQLCRVVGLSRAQLHNKLKALTGQSASIFVRSTRLQKAKELLESSDLNISEVGYEVGFKNPSHFSSAYQSEFGVPPSKTRK
jgi:signal transduction histidine kinase/ligand-binding sensor domain-containing protein/DNA-binding response OmpR family regulator